MFKRIAELGQRWFQKPADEPTFHVPDVSKDDDGVPPAVLRHLRVMIEAMEQGNTLEVGNRQRRLAKLGHEVPTKLSQARELLRKYDAA